MSTNIQIPLQKYAEPTLLPATVDESNSPLSFKEWLKYHRGLVPEQEFKQYNAYLINWYKQKKDIDTTTRTEIRLSYLSLLKQIQLFFSKEEAENWYNNVDLNSEKELLLAIPYFARKLKEISLYYLKVRERIKQARLLYNQIGTDSSIVEEIQNILIENYTQQSNKTVSIPSIVWNNVVELSGITGVLTVEIEELYDTQNYFDKSPTVPISAYFNVNDVDLYNFLSTKGLTLTSTEWMYKLGVNPLSGTLLLPSQGNYTDDDFDYVNSEDEFIFNDLAEKYISENKLLTLQAQGSSIESETYTIEINTQENYFLWPGVAHYSKAKTLPKYRPILLRDLNLETIATGGTDLETSDKIFIKTARGIEAAWLVKNPTVYSTETMYAVIDGGSKTTFLYPFPGYGLSAEGYNWTGPSLTATPQFFYLDDISKEAVENEYWSLDVSLTATNAISINDTTLIQNKAYPNTNYNLADRVIVKQTPPTYFATNDSISTDEAWLYRMNQTDISIGANTENIIYWPYLKLDRTEKFPTYLPTNPADVCLPIALSSIYLPFATTGKTINDADVIYKITNYTDTSANRIQCCWLSGSTANYPSNRAYTELQNSFQGLFVPGIYTKFVWTGKNNTDVNVVFSSLKHQPDCKYVTTKSTFKTPEACTCHQILYTPFGHPGSNFYNFNSLADFIIEDNTPFQQVDLTTLPLSAFCWFKTNFELGWGDGQWLTSRPNTNNRFYLETGKVYGYFRAKPRDEGIPFPNLTIRYDYNTFANEYNSRHIWIGAYKNVDDIWVSTDKPATITVSPGDLLLYDRRYSTQYTLTSLEPGKIYLAENRGSIWANVDYLTVYDTTQASNPQSVTVAYPVRSDYTISNTNTNNQYPRIPIENIIAYRKWEVTHDNTNQSFDFGSGATFSFRPALTGTYSVRLTAISANTSPFERTLFAGTQNPINYSSLRTYTSSTTAVVVFTQIPKITAISPDTFVSLLTTFETPIPGFVINTPLKGWDYNLNEPATNIYFENIGARPYWAKTSKDYKGTNFAGVFPKLLDEHNVIFQPEISEITFNTGQYIEYIRNYPADLNWIQPLNLTTQKQINQWCTILVETTSSNISKTYSDLVITPTLSESDIILQNFVDNEPVEIYYNAIETFTWTVTAVPEINQPQYTPFTTGIGISAKQPWAHLSNLQFPSVAVVPTLDHLHSVSDTGGYFLPKFLGASKYLNLGYSTIAVITGEPINSLFEDSTKTVQTRGFTKQDQPTYYKTIDDNIWIKEPVTTGPIAGTISKQIFKKYQKFIPYQSKYESNPHINLGLVLPNSRQTPWGGDRDLTWTDMSNYPVSPTGQLDIKKWADSQILKQTNLRLDNWVTDIFGNQYGLYKNLTNIKPYNRKNVGGTLWTRSNKQFVSPGYKSLSGVFDTYIGTSIYHELTGFGIRKIEVFFDTLYIETSGAIIFEKLNYDYDTDSIFSTTDDVRFISLAQPVVPNLNREFRKENLSDYKFASVGDTWFFPELKKVLININNVNYTPTDIYNSTFSWEFNRPVTNSFVLSGSVPIPINSDAYLVSIGGVIQPHTTYTINPIQRRLTFNTSIPTNASVYIMLLYNPLLADEYDYLPTQFITTSTTLTSKFSLNDFSNLTEHEGQYIVTINGVLQRPKNLNNDQQTLENSYTIITDGLPAIEFSEPVRPGYTITLTRLPQHIKCISPIPFYTWVKTSSVPTKTMELNGGPGVINDPAAYIVNVGGILQASSNFSINKAARTLTFVENIPPNTYVSITQLSVPQYTVPEPKIYELDLNTQNLKLLFPVSPDHIETLNSLRELRIVELASAGLSYNPETSELLLTMYGVNCNEVDLILETILNYKTSIEIKSFTVYEGFDRRDVIAMPYISENLYTTVTATLTTVNELNKKFAVTNGPATFTLVEGPSWVKLSTDGTFTGTVPKYSDQHYVEFYIQNQTGIVHYNLIIDVIINNND